MALDSKSGSRKISQDVILGPGTRDLTTTGNITAGAFYGDGSHLTGVTTAGANDALITITAGGGLTGGGGFTVDQAVDAIITVSHDDTSAQASVANTAFNVIQSITLDTYGHITAIESQDIGTAGFYVKTTGEVGTGIKIGLGSLTYQTLQFFAGSGIGVVRTDNEIQISHSDTSSAANLTASSRTYVTGLTFDTYGHVTGYTTGTETVVDTNTTYTAGGGLSLAGTVFSHTDTSSQASVNNSNGTVIQDITLDTYGHITALGSVDLDGRYAALSHSHDYLPIGVRYTGNAGDISVSSYRLWDVSTSTDAPSGALDGLLLTGYWDSTSWATQQYHDFHSNTLFIRNKYSGTWQSWKTVIDSSTIGSQSVSYASNAGTLDSIDSSQFLRSDAADSWSGLLSYTGSNNGLQVGGIRGTFGGVELIHLYNRVNIGYPSGWGGQSAPTYGLSVYGGVELATNSGYTSSGDSMRAPIFYDSNNTGYYVDPNSTSVLNSIVFGTSTNGATLSGNSDWGMRFTTTSGYIQFGPANSGWAHIYSDKNFYMNNALWVSGGYRVAAYSLNAESNPLYASIFYDANNTGYYADPASTSNFNALTLAGSFTPDAPSDYWTSAITSLTNAPIYYPEANVGTSSYYLPAIHMRSRYTSGYRTHMNVGLYKLASAWGDNTTGFYVALGGNDSYPTMDWRLTYGTDIYNSNGYVSTPGSFRAPIFYDSNDTGYYLNPAGTSVVSEMRIGTSGNAASWHKITVETGGFLAKSGNRGVGSYADGSTAEIFAYDYSIAQYQPLQLQGSYVSSINSHRAPIFYDSNNTGYYIDPSSTSNLNVVGVANRIYTGYDPGDANSISCSNWFRSSGGTGWYNGSYGGGIHMIDSTWVRVYNGKKFYVDGTASDQIMTNGSVKASVFYDYNDSGYYLDPNSTSNSALRIRGGALHGPNPTWGAYLLVGGDGRQGYVNSTTTASVSTTNGNLHLDAASGYSSYINWYDGNDIYIGNGSEAEIGRIYNAGYLQMTQSVRAPTFYDSTNTAKYLTGNGSTYGAWYMGGSNGGYSGLRVDGGMQLMIGTGGSGGPTGFWLNNWSILTYVNGNQYLYYNGSEKFKTVSGGAQVTGTLYVTGDVIAYYSDIRLKQDIKNIDNAIDKIKKLRGVTYTWNNKEVNIVKERAGTRDIGLIAQEVEEVEPLLITEYQTQLNTPSNDPDEANEFIPEFSESYKTIKYDKIVALLIEAVKEQQNQIEELKAIVHGLTK